MGGEGSGRRPGTESVVKNLLGLNQPANTDNAVIYLPNYSGVQDAVRKDRPGSNFILNPGKILLGASPAATGAINVDGASYTSGEIMSFKNGTVTGSFWLGGATQTLFGNTSAHGVTFVANNDQKWKVNSVAAGTSEFASVQATARIIGGSTNGLSIRDSTNARDNLLIANAGNDVRLNDGTRIGTLGLVVPTGELTSGSIYLQGISSAVGAWLLTQSSGSTVGLGYHDGTQFRSAAEVSRVASGNGKLLLMKTGGNVGIGTTVPDSTLHISGGSMVYSKTTAPTLVTGSGAIFISGGATNTVEVWALGYNGTQVRIAVT